MTQAKWEERVYRSKDKADKRRQALPTILKWLEEAIAAEPIARDLVAFRKPPPRDDHA